jgi:hypothetical protein
MCALELPVSDANNDSVLWALLYDNPVYELAALATLAPSEPDSFGDRSVLARRQSTDHSSRGKMRESARHL